MQLSVCACWQNTEVQNGIFFRVLQKGEKHFTATKKHSKMERCIGGSLMCKNPCFQMLQKGVSHLDSIGEVQHNGEAHWWSPELQSGVSLLQWMLASEAGSALHLAQFCILLGFAAK
jgi:hypothetical protein